MENKYLKKENGITKLELGKPDILDKLAQEKENYHLCFSCSLNCVVNCRKVLDKKKQIISNYDFITGGYQVFNDEDEIDRFVVTDCDNYVPEVKKGKPTKEEAKRIKKAREDLKMLYFGTNTYEEACIKQIEMINHQEAMALRKK